MAWALVGTNGTGSSASSPLGIAKVSGGATLRVAILARTAANDVYTTVTDTGGNTWTKRADSGASGIGRRIEVWDSVNGAAITALSAAFTGAGTALGGVFEWSGHQTVPFDVASALVRASSTTPAALTVTPSASTNLIIAGCMANPNTAAQTVPGGTWIPLTVHANGPACAYRTDPTAGVAIGPSWTLNSASGSGLAVVSYKMAAPSGPTVTVWNGTVELAVTSVGRWNGTTIDAATVEQVTV